MNIKNLGKVMEKNKLTVTEQKIYDFLLQNKGRIMNRADIYSSIYGSTVGYDQSMSRFVDVYIGYLREKGKIITTVRGFGYGIKQ